MNFDPACTSRWCPWRTAARPPHPERDGGFDPAYAYKVLGLYNPSETSECYLMLANTRREIWFIPQRHTRAYGLLDGDALFVQKQINGNAATLEVTDRCRVPSATAAAPLP